MRTAREGFLTGLFLGGGFAQLQPQVIGVVALGAFVFGASILAWSVIKLLVGMRVSRQEEEESLDMGEHGNVAYPDFRPMEAAEAR